MPRTALPVKLSVRILLLWSCLCCTVFSDQLEYTLYHTTDNAEVKVTTSAFSLAKTIWERTVLLLDVELDQVSIPPVDGVSGASRPQRNYSETFEKNRGQLMFGLQQGIGGNTSLSATYYSSQEVDYQSQSGAISLIQELFQKNTTLSLSAQYSSDLVGEIREDGSYTDYAKEVQKASFAITQVLSPLSLIRIGVEGERDLGFLSDPYRKIEKHIDNKNTILVTETHLPERWRSAAWIEYRRYISGLDASLHLNYRAYRDDWELQSHTVSVRANKYITSNFIFSPLYRYYTQNGVYFYKENYGLDDAYYTGDHKLQPKISHSIGGTVTFFFKALLDQHPDLDFLENTSTSLGYFSYFDSKNYQAHIWEGRLRYTF